MKTGNKLIIIILIISAAIAAYAHLNAQSHCLSMIKPKTDSTPSWRAVKFTGAYERSNGGLYCVDANGVKYLYQSD